MSLFGLKAAKKKQNRGLYSSGSNKLGADLDVAVATWGNGLVTPNLLNYQRICTYVSGALVTSNEISVSKAINSSQCRRRKEQTVSGAAHLWFISGVLDSRTIFLCLGLGLAMDR